MSARRVVVTGLMAQYPLGGLTWHYLQYVVGLARMGHDVLYLEDSGQWPYNPVEGGVSESCAYNVAYLEDVLARFGLSGRWAYRFPWHGEWFGLPDDEREEALASADLLINVSGTLDRPEAYRKVRRLAYVDTDPVFTQIRLARGQADITQRIDAHDVHLSFGEDLGPSVPVDGRRWIATRQPVLLSEWESGPPERDVFTTIMNWTSYKDVEWEGRVYGQKNAEFERFVDLPERVAPTRLELALAAGKTQRSPFELLRHRGWDLVDPAEVAGDFDSYRSYVRSSKAEWGVAKGAYATGRPGWFSERSACYLAAGRPVVVQDTGFGAVLPVGEGILPFTDPEGAVAGIRAVESDYERHSSAARRIAEEHFDSEVVLGRLLDAALG